MSSVTPNWMMNGVVIALQLLFGEMVIISSSTNIGCSADNIDHAEWIKICITASDEHK